MAGSLAENVMSGAQEAQNQTGQTVGNAMEAYKIANSLEQSKQKLQLEKDQNEQAKATTFLGQMNSLAGMPDSVRKSVMPGMLDSWKKMYPEMDVNFPKEMMDPNYSTQITQAAARAFKLMREGRDPGPEGYAAINAIPGLSSEQRWAGVQKSQEDYTNVVKAQIGGQAIKAQTGQDNQASMAVDRVLKDSPLNSMIQRTQGANRILGQLDEVRSGKMVDTYQFLNDINTEYVNLLTGVNGSALGKLERTEYTTFQGKLANYMQQAKADPQSINSPKILAQIETGVKSLQHTYAREIDKRADLLKRGFPHNPFAQQQLMQTIGDMKQQYGSQSIASPSVTATPSAPATPEPVSYGATPKEIEENYAKYKAAQAHKQAGGF